MATYTDGTPVPEDGKYHVDPVDPMLEVKSLEPWYPSGVTEFFAGGNTARLGLLPDGTLLKYVRDRDDRSALNSLKVEKCIFQALGQHERIVKYLGEHEHGILLQRAVNGDLHSYISKHGQDSIPLQVRQKWTTQAVEALMFIHSKGVIHCDIHPRNFLLDEQLNVQLCDFAGSLFGSLDGGAMESTRFFLPRDWRETPNSKSDLFAIGSVMYYIMTGHEPYTDLPDEEVASKFGRKEFPDLGGLGCGNVIRGCWMGDSRSAEDVLDTIKEDIFVDAYTRVHRSEELSLDLKV